MNRKLDPEAYAYYISLGAGRSYQAVADHFGVSKRTVTTTATREHWQELLAKADDRARDNASDGYVESMQQMSQRHLKVMRFMLGRAIDGMKTLPINSFADAARVAAVAIDRERLIRGEPTERTENVEAIIRREHERWSKPAGEDEWADVVDDEKSGGESTTEQPAGESERDGEVAA